jgi:hypothetical protein
MFKFLYLLTKQTELLLTLYFVGKHGGNNNNKKENIYSEPQMNNLYINNILYTVSTYDI